MRERRGRVGRETQPNLGIGERGDGMCQGPGMCVREGEGGGGGGGVRKRSLFPSSLNFFLFHITHFISLSLSLPLPLSQLEIFFEESHCVFENKQKNFPLFGV